MLALSLSILMFQGCPDPTTASDLGHGPGGSATPGAPGADGGAGMPLGPPPEPGSFEVEAGQGVLISGKLVYNGNRSGTFRVDFLQKDGDAPPTLAHMIEMDAPGDFQVEAPKGTGALYVVGFVDEEGDGPSLADPGGMLAEPIVVDESPVLDLVLQLTDAPDLGDFTPGDHKVSATTEISSGEIPADEAQGAADPDVPAEDAQAPEAEAPADDEAEQDAAAPEEEEQPDVAADPAPEAPEATESE